MSGQTVAFGRTELPEEQRSSLRRAIRLERVTLVYMVTCIVVVYLVMGSSQAMKAAWIEDLLAFIPPIAFLVAQRRARRPVDHENPYGHHRAVGAGHLAAAVALLGTGAYLIYDSASGLVKGEHPPLATVSLLGHSFWAGWLMIAAMVYTGVGPVILGRLKAPLADALHDRILYADADMQKADWMTAAGSVAGIVGIGLGLWWADAVVAIAIALSIVRDGWSNVRHAAGALLDSRALTVDGSEPHPLTHEVDTTLADVAWVARATSRVRDMGHLLHTECFVVPRPGFEPSVADLEHVAEVVRDLDWKLDDVVVMPVRELPEELRR